MHTSARLPTSTRRTLCSCACDACSSTSQSSMPPRHSGRVAAAAVQRTCAFPRLPLECTLHIFSLLPPDQRLRCAEVSRGWRATVAQPALWRRLDLSWEGCHVRPVWPALLRAAVARAGDALTAITVPVAFLGVTTLCDALRASTGLAEAHLGEDDIAAEDLVSLLAGLPQIRALHARVTCEPQHVVGMLQGRPPFEPLHLHALSVSHDGAALETAHVLALADARLQPGLASLEVLGAVVQPGTLDLLVDAVVARPSLTRLSLRDMLPPPSAPALVRLLLQGALTELELSDDLFSFDVAGAAAVCDALRANSTLTSLTLMGFREPATPVLVALLGSLVGHRSLSTLNLTHTHLDNAGPALAALLAADAPALTEMHVSSCSMGAAGLSPLCDALARNTHLRLLNLYLNPVPAGFLRARLLPALRSNTGLRTLWVHSAGGDDEAAAEREVWDILRAR